MAMLLLGDFGPEVDGPPEGINGLLRSAASLEDGAEVVVEFCDERVYPDGALHQLQRIVQTSLPMGIHAEKM